MTNEKGILVRWVEDKGFGFIKPEKGANDIFIHISALKGMSRKPIVGDVIHYQISIAESGKTCVINANIGGESLFLRKLVLRTSCPNKRQKLNATAHACGCPSRPCYPRPIPNKGYGASLRNDWTRCRKAAHFHYANNAP